MGQSSAPCPRRGDSPRPCSPREVQGTPQISTPRGWWNPALGTGSTSLVAAIEITGVSRAGLNRQGFLERWGAPEDPTPSPAAWLGLSQPPARPRHGRAPRAFLHKPTDIFHLISSKSIKMLFSGGTWKCHALGGIWRGPSGRMALAVAGSPPCPLWPLARCSQSSREAPRAERPRPPPSPWALRGQGRQRGAEAAA